MTSELRPAVEVWFDASRNWLETKYPFECEAAAAVIEADREAVRAEMRQALIATGDAAATHLKELAKFKALAETLAGALEKIGLGFTIELDDEDGPVNVWMDAEELSDLAREALRKWEEARDD